MATTPSIATSSFPISKDLHLLSPAAGSKPDEALTLAVGSEPSEALSKLQALAQPLPPVLQTPSARGEPCLPYKSIRIIVLAEGLRLWMGRPMLLPRSPSVQPRLSY